MRSLKHNLGEAIKMSERDFSTLIEDMLRLNGYRFAHFRPARTEHGWRTAYTGASGFPDYICVKGNRLLFLEIKSDKGRVTPEQYAWMEALGKAGAEVFIWRPKDYDKDNGETILRILRNDEAGGIE